MRKITIMLIILTLISLGFFSGCIKVNEELTQMSIISFDIEPGIINPGETANLTWTVINADSIYIDNGIGVVALTGHRIIQPKQNTTYILTASNTTTTKSATATIFINSSKQTPTIKCITNSSANRLIITSIDENVKWSDIAITTNPIAPWQVQDADRKQLAKIGNTSTIIKYVTAGDNIVLLETVGNITVNLTFIPTNAFLGSWIVDV